MIRAKRHATEADSPVMAFLRGDPPPVGTTPDDARRLTLNYLFPEAFPLPVSRLWAEHGETVLATWRGPGRPWGQQEAEAEASHPYRRRGVGCWVLEHPHWDAWRAAFKGR